METYGVFCEVGSEFLDIVYINFMAIYLLLTYSMEQSPSWEANWFCS